MRTVNLGRTCSSVGCQKPAHSKGLCPVHYQQQRTGWKPKPPKRCLVDGCARPYYGKGFCALHYSRAKNEKPLGAKVPSIHVPVGDRMDYARLDRMVGDRQNGMSLESIGRKHGLSRERVRQLLLKARKKGMLQGLETLPTIVVTCKAEACDRQAQNRGYCCTHWAQLKKHGKTEPIRLQDPTLTTEGRQSRCFERKVLKQDGHWLWTGFVTKHNIPIMTPTSKTSMSVRQYVWKRFRTESPPNLISPTCGEALCVNPEHLERCANGGKPKPKVPCVTPACAGFAKCRGLCVNCYSNFLYHRKKARKETQVHGHG